MKKKIFFILRLAVSAGLIGYFLITLSNQQGGMGAALERIAQAFSHASLKWLIPALLLHLVGYSLISLRWKLMLEAQDIDSAYGRLFLYYIMAAFFNTFLPSTIGGDAIRALESRKLTGKTSVSVVVVILERLTGMIALVLISTAAFMIESLFFGSSAQGIWVFLIILGLIGLFIVLAQPKIAPRILLFLKKILPGKAHKMMDETYQLVSIYYRRPFEFFSALLVSIVFELNMILYYFLIARALGQNPKIIDFLIKIPIMVFLLMVIPAINGLGVRTASFRGLMKFSPALALSGEFLDLGMRLIYGIFGGLIFLFYRRPDHGKSPDKN